MYEPTELFTVMALAIFVMGIFVSFVVVCGVANAREELSQLKRAAASADRSRGTREKNLLQRGGEPKKTGSRIDVSAN